MGSQSKNFSRYLPPDRQSRRWGWRLLDAGRQDIPPSAPYPSSGHPLGYLFDEHGRRTLEEFQIVFLTGGRGDFESASSRRQSVHAGDAMLLFPGEWHRYGPDPQTGWNEYWLGFRGQDAERVMATFFDRRTPVLHPAQSGEIMRLFDQLLDWVHQPVPGIEQVLASHVPLILGFLQAGGSTVEGKDPDNSRIIMEAKLSIVDNLAARTDMQALAGRLGVSYSKFRSLFKAQTGYSPREYENLIKLNRARDLLKSGQYNVSTTAEALGYASLYYFSRAFKKQFGLSPREWKSRSSRG